MGASAPNKGGEKVPPLPRSVLLPVKKTGTHVEHGKWTSKSRTAVVCADEPAGASSYIGIQMQLCCKCKQDKQEGWQESQFLVGG